MGVVVGRKRAGWGDVKGGAGTSHVIYKGVHVDMPGGGCDEVDNPMHDRLVTRWLICCRGAESDMDLLGTSRLVSSFDQFWVAEMFALGTGGGEGEGEGGGGRLIHHFLLFKYGSLFV